MPDNPADQFSDEEMEQMKRHGAAQLGGTAFSDEVEKELNKLQAKREASAGKMKAAQTGGGLELGPSDMDEAAIKQRGAIDQEATTQGAVQAAKAQGQQVPVDPVAGPSGPQGTTTTFPAQKGAVGGPGNAPAPSQAPPPPAPGPQQAPPPEEDEEGPPQ